MKRLLILIGFMLYIPFGYASSQPPTILGNFSNQNFTPRGGVVPDTGPTELSPGFTLIQGVASEGSNLEQLAADEPLITVGGHVKIMSNPVPNAAGVSTRILVDAKGVEVMFWQPQNPGHKRTTVTDDDGNYEVQLTNGFWRGEACGSGVGYSPNAWEVSLRDNKLIQMQEVSYSAPKITPNQIDLAMLENNVSADNAISTFLKSQGEELSINGEGFGCNGSLVFDFHNSVGNCGEVNPVQYNHQLIVKSKDDFKSRSDNKIIILMPSLYDANADYQVQHDDIRRIAKMYYLKGNQRSNAIFVGEYLGEAFAAGPAYDFACLGIPINGDGELTNQAGELENVGEDGPVLIDGVMGGFDVITQDDIAMEGNLDFIVDTGALQMRLGL